MQFKYTLTGLWAWAWAGRRHDKWKQCPKRSQMTKLINGKDAQCYQCAFLLFLVAVDKS